MTSDILVDPHPPCVIWWHCRDPPAPLECHVLFEWPLIHTDRNAKFQFQKAFSLIYYIWIAGGHCYLRPLYLQCRGQEKMYNIIFVAFWPFTLRCFQSGTIHSLLMKELERTAGRVLQMFTCECCCPRSLYTDPGKLFRRREEGSPFQSEIKVGMTSYKT